MKRRVRGFLVLLIIALAVGGVYYWTLSPQHPASQEPTASHGPTQFVLVLEPSFFHVAAGEGKRIAAYVQRSTGFSGAVRLELVNPPNWVTFTPQTVSARDSNTTFVVAASQNAPQTQLNLTMRASSAGVPDQMATLDMKVVSVSTVTSKYGSAVVYDTTKVLDASTLQVLSSYLNGTFLFSSMTPQLQRLSRGDVMVVPPSSTSLAKHGLLRLVLSVTQQGGRVIVQTYQATLFDELQQVDIGRVETKRSPKASLTPASSSSPSRGSTGAGLHVAGILRPEIGVEYDDWIPVYKQQFGMSGPANLGGDVTFSAGADMEVDFVPGIHIHLNSDTDYVPALTYAKMHLAYSYDAHLSLKGSAGSTLNWPDKDLQDLYDASISILPPVVWISLKATLEGRASGNLNQNLNLNLHLTSYYEMGPTYDSDIGSYFYKRCNSPNQDECNAPTNDHTFTISPGSGSDAKIGIGPRFEIGVNGDVGAANAGGWASLSANFFTRLQSLIPSKPSWWVDWGIDGYFEVGLSFTVGRWGISKTFGFTYGPWTAIVGQGRLFDGPNLPPLVKITNPQDGAVLDYNKITIFPTFTATATDPENGDLCGGPKSHLVWSSNLDGQIGTGCSFPATFKKEGVHRITFTATDNDMRPSSSTVTVTVILPTPQVFITRPQSADTIYRGQSVTLEGYAGIGAPMSYLSCDKLVFSIAATGSPQTFTPHTSTQSYCAVQVTFNAAGSWRVTLTATDTAGMQGTATVNVIVKESPSNYPPYPEISDPTDGAYYMSLSDSVSLKGTIYDQEGDPITSFTWYSSYLANPNFHVPTTKTIATGTLSTSKCVPTSRCTVTASLKASDYCGLPAFPYEVGGKLTIVLEATQTSPSTQTGRDTVTITLSCKKPLSSPPHTEGIPPVSMGELSDRTFESWPRSQTKYPPYSYLNSYEYSPP